jgi:acyl-CoA synthetase (AMP-forming)/AMP-acid ligase II
VQTAHVVGIADDQRGENIAALVVLRPLRQATADELRAFCRETLASYKVPRFVFLVGEREVPRNGTGKVEKAALRRAAEALVARGAAAE